MQVKQQIKTRLVFVAVGGNVTSSFGSPYETVRAAMDEMAQYWAGFQISTYYQTPAFPIGSGPDFVNAVCGFTTDEDGPTVLNKLHQIEEKMGRIREKRWGQRTIDLDLIALGDSVLPDLVSYDYWLNLPLDEQVNVAPNTLVVPHPRVQDRSFVLIPLADIAPEWVHPRLGLTTQQMLDARPIEERQTVIPLTA